MWTRRHETCARLRHQIQTAMEVLTAAEERRSASPPHDGGRHFGTGMTLKSKLSLETFAEGEGASPELQALIGAHEAAYVALHRVVHRAGSSSHDRKRAVRIEEEALLAICS
jgi:hypothetical protein